MLHAERVKNKNYKLNVGGTDERDIERAIQASMQEAIKKQQQ